MRKPRVIWLPRRRPSTKAKRPDWIAGSKNRRPEASPDPGPPKGAPGRSMLGLYLVTLMVAGAVLWWTPHRSNAVLPVSAHPSSPLPRSWLSRWLNGTRITVIAAEGWIRSGIPLWRFSLSSTERWHWASLIGAGLADLAGTRLDSLEGLIAQEIPQISQVAPPVLKSSPQHRPVPAKPLVRSGLPGDQGRVFAVLGKNPEVGLYQTMSMETFAGDLASRSSVWYSSVWSRTIVAVGWHLALDLQRQEIPVVQARVNNMSNGVLASYYTSYQTARRLLAQFPTIKVLLDVQRGQSDSPGNIVRVHGTPMARVSLVVGTGQILADPHWHQNLDFAEQLKAALRAIDPGMISATGIDLVPYRYNQQLLDQDVIVHIGGPNNTMVEENRSALAVALALKQVLARSTADIGPIRGGSAFQAGANLLG